MDWAEEEVGELLALTKEQNAQLKRLKQLAERVDALTKELWSTEATDKRAVTLARTDLQAGFMWARRAIVKPKAFG